MPVSIRRRMIAVSRTSRKSRPFTAASRPRTSSSVSTGTGCSGTMGGAHVFQRVPCDLTLLDEEREEAVQRAVALVQRRRREAQVRHRAEEVLQVRAGEVRHAPRRVGLPCQERAQTVHSEAVGLDGAGGHVLGFEGADEASCGAWRGLQVRPSRLRSTGSGSAQLYGLGAVCYGSRGLARTVPAGLSLFGTPDGIRTRAAGLKGRYPGPLDDGGVRADEGPPGRA